jgi:hypothetical protein
MANTPAVGFDRWGMPRTPRVYPATTSNGYYAAKQSVGGVRGKALFFGHRAYGGAKNAYQAAKAFAASYRDVGEPRRKSAVVAGRGAGRSKAATTLGKHGVSLRIEKSATTGDRYWKVIAFYSTARKKQWLSFSVKRYGLSGALHRAISARLAWESQNGIKASPIEASDWVRLMRYTIEKRGAQPLVLTDLPLPGTIKVTAKTVTARAKTRHVKHFAIDKYADDHDATAAAVIWLISALELSDALPELSGEAPKRIRNTPKVKSAGVQRPPKKARKKRRYVTTA